MEMLAFIAIGIAAVLLLGLAAFLAHYAALIGMLYGIGLLMAPLFGIATGMTKPGAGAILLGSLIVYAITNPKRPRTTIIAWWH